MALQNFVNERLKITSNTKPLYRPKPESKEQLQSIIKDELERQGPDADLNFIDTSLITDMSMLFWWIKIGNIKIDQWDVSNVTNMRGMFKLCSNFNADLSGWDTSNVKDMSIMFFKCSTFEGNGLENWDVSNVKHMSRMFENCENLNVDLSKWGTLATNVRDILLMFYNCKKFRCNLSHWDLSKNT